MHDPLMNEEPKPLNPFVSSVHSNKQALKEIDSAVFLKTAFDQSPSKGLELLFRRFYSPLCSHAVRFVYSKQVAEDLVSEVFFQFFFSFHVTYVYSIDTKKIRFRAQVVKKNGT